MKGGPNRGGEDRVTLGASLMCKDSSQFCLFLVASFSFQSAQMKGKKIAHSVGQIMQSSQIFHVFHSPEFELLALQWDLKTWKSF